MADSSTTEPYQSLYRRYRPQRFAEVRGQEHVTRALRNAVREAKVAHAYLFSGPRGTGKTSTARILAMALNCENPDDGEPDGTCRSCVEIRRGASVDVQELDAASNRGLDEMKELLSRVALASPGRWKVYIVDEVHQLTSHAASALLKTLEEPPGHVVFVLATTDPQKVLPTIRSRTQHFEFHLLGADVLGSLLRDVNEQAGLGVPPEAIDLVVRRGHGSARDALSVLDQVAAAGGVEEEAAVVGEIVDALAEKDAGGVLAAVAEATSAGRDARRLASDLLEHLRNCFLATQARSLVMLADEAVEEVEEQAHRLGRAALVRAMEVLGQATADMRDCVDPRVTLEAALVRLASPDLDNSYSALLERLERLERAVGAKASPSSPAAGPALLASPAGPPPPPPAGGRPATPGAPGTQAPFRPGPPGGPTEPAAPLPAGRPALGALRRQAPPPGGRPHAGASEAAPGSPASEAGERAGEGALLPRGAEAPEAGSEGAMPTRDELTKAWGDHVLPRLRPGVKVFLSSGRFVGAGPGGAVYALPDRGLLERAEPLKGEAEAALAEHFGRAVPLRLVLDDQATAVGRGLRTPRARASGGPEGQEADRHEADWHQDDRHEDDRREDDVDLEDLQDAGEALRTPEQRLLEAFPGAEEVVM